MKYLALLLALAPIVLIACGGGGGSLQSGRVLHLANEDVTEENFRNTIDENLKTYECGLTELVGRETWVKGFTDPGARKETPAPVFTLIPSQRGDQADAEFAADYIINHCKSVLGH